MMFNYGYSGKKWNGYAVSLSTVRNSSESGYRGVRCRKCITGPQKSISGISLRNKLNVINQVTE